jgi:tRNA G18 (ribose-2'-O)-methylase SpoU
MVLILYNIRSVQNVGSIFRTADAAGISHIYIVGYTPTPIDRFGRKRADMAKTSLGAETTVSWSQEKTIQSVCEKLRAEKYTIVALEQSPKSIDYKKYKSDKPIALIVGNEVTGIEQSVLNEVDTIVEIPMAGSKESLNVAVAAGIAIFRLLDI